MGDRVVIHIKDKAYDVTDFISRHPGGREAILRHAGEDCTEHFKFHSPQAQKLWKTFEVPSSSSPPSSSHCAIS